MRFDLIFLFSLCVVSFCFATVMGRILNAEKSSSRVCIIGAGVAGLSSARYLKEEGIDFVVFEATNYVGGTWRYESRVGTDENGLPIFTSMYKHLRTNLPKQTMQLLGFPLPKDTPSYPSWKLYYEYLKNFTRHFELEKHIQYHHLVISVRRGENHWKVKSKNILTGEVYKESFDFVFVCTGHYAKPKLPVITNESNFKGTIIHSHDYREPDTFRGRRVLVVGAGPSGVDIGLEVADVSKTLIHSTHTTINFKTPVPPHFIKKPDVLEFKENGVVFVDGSFEEIDDVIYCTGFEYSYPFLDESSGLTLSPQYVTPLYQYMVNVRQPTMLLMGLVVRACIVACMDAQARYATALVKGNFTLPSEDGMMAEWQSRADLIRAQNRLMRDIHLLAEREDQYYEAISKESGTVRVPSVLFKMRITDMQAKIENWYTYRNYEYDVIDNENFTRKYIDPRRNDSCIP